MHLKIRLLIVLSFVVVCTLTVNARLSAATAANRAVRSSGVNTQENTISLQDFGAIGDGVADDGPALQAALDALADAGGGTLIVPAGRYAIITPVEKNFYGVSNVTIIGAGPIPDDGSGGYGSGLGLSSEFFVAVGETNTALSIIGVKNFLIQDITFIGNPAVIRDCRITLSVTNVDRAIVRHCEFYGLGAIVDDGAIVYAYQSNLTVEDSAFLGCSTATSSRSAVIQNISWRGITITGTRFIDYGNRADYFSKTTLSPPNSWISIGNAAEADANSSRREVVLRDLFLDEGVYNGISCFPSFFSSNSTPINLVFMSGIQMNVNNLASRGIVLSNVERVLIEKSYLGWSHNADSAISLFTVGEAIIDQVECAAHADRIRADAETNRLTVVNSIYEHLDSSAPITEVVNTESLDADPVQYVRQQYLNTLGREPDPSGYFYWASRLLHCGQDADCAVETRNALADYLGNNPSPTFTLSGQVAESDGRTVSGATVTLSGSAGWVAQTDGNGNYSFPNLPTGGSYTLTVTRSNYIFDVPSQIITAPVGNRTADFSGRMITYSITGRAANQSGKGIIGAVMILEGSQSATATTDSNGEFRFDDVRAEGEYSVSIQRENYDFEPQAKTIDGLSANLTADFTGTVHKYTISGDINMSGVDVTLSGGASESMRTGADGAYSFTVDAEGDYTIKASKTHYTFAPDRYTFTNLVGHQTLNFEPTLNTHTISGSTGLPDVSVTLSGDADETITTGVDGEYLFTVNAGGNYTVTPLKTHYTFAPLSRSFTDLSDNQRADFNGTLNTYTINGSCGLPGVEVTLQGDSSGVVTTGADGRYSFTVNGGGSYTLTASKTHYTFAPPSHSFSNVSGNQTADFEPQINAYTISGTTGVEGIKVSLSGDATGSVTTNANGLYSFTVNALGNYTITAEKAEYVFAPPGYSFTSLGSNQTANFVGTLKPVLLTEKNSDLALALTTVNLARDPFSVVNTMNFSPDLRTRIMIFALNARLQPGETASVVAVQAEDSQHNIYPLTVEYVGDVGSLTHLTQINVKLADAIYNVGDVWLSIKVRGIASNKARIRIVPQGSGAP